ncbi:MAG: type II toxin-antitoxin system PemK/MazF family toxin [Caulobacteraceae bacterium]
MKGAARPIGRGDIWWATLDPTVGSEIRKTRPCLVVSPDEMHQHLRTVMVAPMTSAGRAAAFRVPVAMAGVKGLILLDQIRTLDRSRLVRREGVVSRSVRETVFRSLRAMFED